MSERRRTAFAEILSLDPQISRDKNEEEALTPEGVADDPIRNRKTGPIKPNKAVNPRFTKLTAYVPRTLAAAIKMSMALDETTDQSDYLEKALVE